MTALSLVPGEAAWRSRKVQYYAGDWSSIQTVLPEFDLQPFVAGPDEPANPFLQTVVRRPLSAVHRRAGRVADRLAGDGAAVAMLPGWPGVMAADRLVVEKEGRDRLAEHPGELADPGELAVVSGFTLIDLRTLGTERRDDFLVRCGDCRRHLR
jgi:hypothetical protein